MMVGRYPWASIAVLADDVTRIVAAECVRTANIVAQNLNMSSAPLQSNCIGTSNSFMEFRQYFHVVFRADDKQHKAAAARTQDLPPIAPAARARG